MLCSSGWRKCISIHALREEGDGDHPAAKAAQNHFYPRPPRGGRRSSFPFQVDSLEISIHALREEGDGRLNLIYFDTMKFLSTPSARRATV